MLKVELYILRPNFSATFDTELGLSFQDLNKRKANSLHLQER